MVIESTHPHAGPMREPRPAARFEATPAELRIPAPLLGEHTDAVLTEAGITGSELAELHTTGVVA